MPPGGSEHEEPGTGGGDDVLERVAADSADEPVDRDVKLLEHLCNGIGDEHAPEKRRACESGGKQEQQEWSKKHGEELDEYVGP